MTTTTIDQSQLQAILVAQRPRLLGLCAYLTGDPDSAEDVVQEVMLEAWRSLAKLRNPEAVEAWLNGLVRNVCARWQRTRGRESAIMVHEEPTSADADSILDKVADDFDLEVELDRQELAVLLDRALALLPETTRDVLVGKFIAESRHAEIAQQLGLTENAVMVRLHRGKAALRKLLTTELRADAESFGLVTPDDAWVETRLWCPICGQRRLLGKLTESEFAVRCPTCSIGSNVQVADRDWLELESPFGQLTSFRSIFKRHLAMIFDLYIKVMSEGEYVCPLCNASSPLHLHLPDDYPLSIPNLRGLHVACWQGHSSFAMPLQGLALSSPEGRSFWQAHPRIRMLPEREIVFEGLPAIVLPLASVTDSATFDVIVHADTYDILASYRSDEL